MKEIKLKRIDNIVIVVSDSILNRTLPKGEEGEKMYEKIERIIAKLNSGLLSFKNTDRQQEKLLSIMMPKPKREFKEKTPLSEAYDLAEGDVSPEERIDMAQKIVDVSDVFEEDDGFVYLKKHSVPIPIDLAKAIVDASENPDSKFTVESLVNFWKWALLNPNPEARVDLFGWFKTGKFSITEQGFIIAYRCVNLKKKGVSDALTLFIEESFTKIKSWKKSPKNYAVMYIDGEYSLLNVKANSSFDVDIKGYVGFLSDLKADLTSNEQGDVYTDNHTGKMIIKIGEEVSMPREDCDSDRHVSCSRGLHFMSKKYGLRLGNNNLIVLINPMNIVAFPSYDNTKGRCCAYLPVSKALFDKKGDLLEFEPGSYDFEYAKYTQEKLDDLINTIGFQEMQNRGLISDAIKLTDFIISKEQFVDAIKDKVVYAD